MSIIVRQQHDTHGGLKTDLRDFLGVKADMPEPVKEGKRVKPKLQKMDICEPEFAALRAELVEIGERASLMDYQVFGGGGIGPSCSEQPDFSRRFCENGR
jgi:hypothetical protein